MTGYGDAAIVWEVDDELTPLDFVGSSQQDLRGFPEAVRYEIGHALYVAQRGGKHASAKPLKGEAFKGAGVLEVVERFDGDTYRAVYVYGQVSRPALCAACIPEEIKDG